jgi:hypothetical protein
VDPPTAQRRLELLSDIPISRWPRPAISFKPSQHVSFVLAQAKMGEYQTVIDAERIKIMVVQVWFGGDFNLRCGPRRHFANEISRTFIGGRVHLCFCDHGDRMA